MNPIQPSVAAPAGAEALPVAWVTLDQRGTIRSHNAAFEELLGATPGSIFVGRPLRNLMPSGSQVAFDLGVLPALRLGQAVSEAALMVRGPGGADIPVLCFGASAALPAHAQLVLVPIGSRHRIERELARVNDTVEQVPGAIFRLEESPAGRLRCSFLSGDAVVMLGVQRGRLHGRLWNSMSRASRRAFAAAMVAAARNYHVFQFDLPVPDAGAGPVRWLQIQARPQLLPSGARIWYGHLMDVSALKLGQAAQTDERERLRATVESLDHALLTTDTQGLIVALNPAAERLTGWSRTDALGQPIDTVVQLIGEASEAAQDTAVLACLRDGALRPGARHSLLVARDGLLHRVEHVATPIRAGADALLGAALVLHDASEQRELSEEAQYRVAHDPLTGLINRREFEQRLARLLRRVRVEPAEHALLYLDLDQFQLVNDACGHPAGDTVLRQLARLLTDSVRVRDTVARVGGDEFAVVLEHCGCAQAEHIGEHICERMEEFRFMHQDRSFRLGASVGLVMVSADWNEVARLLRAAETACATAKESGRNRVHTWFDTGGLVGRLSRPSGRSPET